MIGALRRFGVLGINRRNADYTLAWNQRRLYPLVDDKLTTKRLCAAAGIPCRACSRRAPLRAAPAAQSSSARLLRAEAGARRDGQRHRRGAGRRGDRFVRAGGRGLARGFLYHAAGIISASTPSPGTRLAAVEERLRPPGARGRCAATGARRARDRLPRRAGDEHDAPADPPVRRPRESPPGRLGAASTSRPAAPTTPSCAAGRPA
jgi:hypothetical protein